MSGRRDAAEWRTRLLRMEECMDLVNIRDLFRSKDEYLDTTVTIGGWVRSLRKFQDISALSLSMTVRSLSRCRWYIPNVLDELCGSGEVKRRRGNHRRRVRWCATPEMQAAVRDSGGED